VKHFKVLEANATSKEKMVEWESLTLVYDIMEKQAYALVKAQKEFITYILQSHMVAYVLSNSVKDIPTQPDPEGRRGKWIAIMLEYDLEINPTKLIKGQGLAKWMAQSNCDDLGINFIVDLIENPKEETTVQVSEKIIDSPWYRDIIYVLKNLQAPPRVK
jgi:hypothetical protein